MKLIFTFFLALLFIGNANAQVVNATLMHDGIERSYILYVPTAYTGDESVPLVFNFHGFGSNATEQLFYGDFRAIADTANFLVVQPEGTEFNGTTHFNVGGFTLGSTTDDIGFTAAMIDSISAEYNVNLDRVYSTGMSNGGFMSFLLACQLSDKIAAVASVTGSMTPETFDDCDPQHPMPVMQIHGTSDATVPYDGASFSEPIEDVVDYWVNFNNNDETVESIEIEDSAPADGSTAERFIYSNGDNGVVTEHIKIEDGAHTWPGSAFVFPGTNLDFSASQAIWEFFSQYDINGEIDPVSTEEISPNSSAISVFPNPVSDFLQIATINQSDKKYQLFSGIGELILEGQTVGNKTSIELSGLPLGVYFLQVENEVFKVMKQ